MATVQPPTSSQSGPLTSTGNTLINSSTPKGQNNTVVPLSQSTAYPVCIANAGRTDQSTKTRPEVSVYQAESPSLNAFILTKPLPASRLRQGAIETTTSSMPIAAQAVEAGTTGQHLHARNVIPTPSRAERKTQFGIDCAEMVHFARWEPGGEHVKYLSVKNIVMKTQKIKYKLPQTRYFSMEFPETQTLSAGMSWTVPITFRPVAKECYHDVIEFTTSFGKFFLPIKATLPEHVLEFPKTIDFSLCPVRETAKRTFQLKNTGELTSYFEWEISAPFAISPQNGSLSHGNSCTITVEFTPVDASVFTATVVCSFGDKSHWEKSKVRQAMTVNGIGKYSHLTLASDTNIFDFGEVFIGKSAEKKIVLKNHSAVPANFCITRSERNTDSYFEFSILSGTVASKKQLDIGIKYTPMASGMYSNDYFNINTLSGNTIVVTCQGCGTGPKVTLNPDVVNFHDTPAGSTVTRALYLQNNANTSAFYQFLAEPASTFQVDKICGIIGPNSSVALTVKFSPTEPINYYRRVYCLVEHQDALHVDFIGTCYNDKRRPATFKPHHISNYQQRVKNGLWQYGPEQLEDMLKTGVIFLNNGILSFTNDSVAKQHAHSSLVDSPYSDGLVGSEYFYENTGPTVAASLVNSYVDFGACSRYRIIEPQVICISNNTKGKMSCVWVIPGEADGEEPTFSVTPKVADILAKSTMQFKVNFRPTVDNSFYGAQLECFVYYKSMRNFRLVNEDTFTPSWCLTPTVAGNTFTAGEDTFIPKISFGATKLDFPACHVDKSVYRTVQVTNLGDTFVKFSFLENSSQPNTETNAISEFNSKSNNVFSAKPQHGILHKGESRLIVFRFSPSEQKEYLQALKCYFNNSLGNSYASIRLGLQMHGVGHYPRITFDGNGVLCFKPTCIGAIAVRHFVIRNTSRILVNYKWHIPEQYNSVVSIEPLSGILASNSSANLICTFAPNCTSNYSLVLPCYYSHEITNETSAIVKKKASFTVFGRGIIGTIVAKPQVVDFETILVNTVSEKEILLFNPSECDVFYTLEIYRKKPSTGTHGKIDIVEELLENDITVSELEIVQKLRSLPARSNQALKIKACVHEQTRQEFHVYYRIQDHTLTDTEGRLTPSVLQKKRKVQRYHLCDVVAVGVHPVVQASYIHCEGISKTILWEMFSLNKFNEILREPETGQNAYAEQTLDDNNSFPIDLPMQLTPNQNEINFDFGATSVSCKPTLLSLTLTNSGVVSVDWVFHFPNDLEVEIEHWADPGDYTEEQLHQNLILDNNIFCVTPKHGSLCPGESVNAIMSYSHEFAGSHKLAVVFKLYNGTSQSGKEIMINFTGYSVPPAKKYLQIQAATHELVPIFIGTTDPPIQTYRLMNRGAVSLEYSIDTSSLERLKEDNHNFEVFKCLHTSGCIPPGGYEYVQWLFHPLEEKIYEVDIPISIVSGKSYMVTLKGKGERPLDIHNEERLDPKSYQVSTFETQTSYAQNHIAALSLENINFGHVPLESTMRQVIGVLNTSNTADIFFKWSVPTYWPSGEIMITPLEGRLKPGESRICKVVFSPKHDCRIYDMDIVCNVGNATEMETLSAQRDGVNIVSKQEKCTGVSEAVSLRDSIQTKDRCLSLNNTVGSLGVDISRLKYRTLPAISSPTPNQSQSTTSESKRRVKVESTHDSVRLSPHSARSGVSDCVPLESSRVPVSFQKFVSIRARTYKAEEFRRLFKGYDQFYQNRQQEQVRIFEPNHDIVSNQEEKNAVQSMIQSLLSDIFQDSDVLGIPTDTLNGSLFYYAQIASNPNLGIVLQSTDSACTASAVKTIDKPDRLSRKNHSEFVSDLSIITCEEFQNAVEAVLEGTLYNLIQEANAGEFQWHKYPILFDETKLFEQVVQK
ncbi:hypothetical protein BDEG_27330 [Batrachochytrium dendrobatidis JEL423]|uniref:MSP domain-containing protein n=1 Tax=Batrachochytrium dendrobatidis (strain JEL423) TaxID=403673 RepID=A0A177WVY3_BATDL|nr:hypothetical protein BDEG_27330 [Batrachochytrium dendrobatidis JEL423]